MNCHYERPILGFNPGLGIGTGDGVITGIVMTPIGQGTISFVSALALQSDGKIVAAGNYAPPAQDDYVNNFAVARYLAQ